MNLAAIDIGSNAMRLLVAEPRKTKNGLIVKKQALVRVPIRLGETVFSQGRVTPEKEAILVNAIKAYKLLMDTYNVRKYKAVATSAMREATNKDDVLKRVKLITGVDIHVISGRQEAEIIRETFSGTDLDKEKDYLYIDVGGGSTELSIIKHGLPQKSKSFQVGTVRLLQNLVDASVWKEIDKWLNENLDPKYPYIAIGTGGNINRVIKLFGTRKDRSITLDVIKEFHKDLQQLDIQERMDKYSMKLDRADVIVPALEIYTHVMQKAKITDIEVPKIGLADGIIYQIYKQMKLS